MILTGFMKCIKIITSILNISIKCDVMNWELLFIINQWNTLMILISDSHTHTHAVTRAGYQWIYRTWDVTESIKTQVWCWTRLDPQTISVTPHAGHLHAVRHHTTRFPQCSAASAGVTSILDACERREEQAETEQSSKHAYSSHIHNQSLSKQRIVASLLQSNTLL